MLIDPVQPKEILSELKKISVNGQYHIKAILTTHHHNDHSGGNDEIIGLIPYPVPVYGGDFRIPALTNHLFKDSEYPFHLKETNSLENELMIGTFKILPLFTPGHTKGSICYVIFDTISNNALHVFTGDTLFLSGCGRFFDDCKPEEMLYSMRLLKSLSSIENSDRIFIYPGHEYALNNVSFSLTIDPTNIVLQVFKSFGLLNFRAGLK